MSNPLPSVSAGQPPAVVPVNTAPASSFWERVTDWMSENKAVVYTVAGVGIVVTGAGVAYYLTPTSQSAKSKDKKRKRKSVGEDKAPAKGPSSVSDSQPSLEESLKDLPDITEDSVGALSADQRIQYSKTLKEVGNRAYGSKQYHRAIDLYTKAILCNANDAVFYSNRAACNYTLGNHAKVVQDCTTAFNLNPEYAKALNRRAAANKNLKRYHDSLVDFIALCIVEKFKNPETSQSVDEMLDMVVEEKIENITNNRTAKLPSYIFVGNYLQSFRKKPRPVGLQDTDEIPDDSGRGQLRLGLRLQEKKTWEGYEEARAAFDKAVELGDLGEFEALAYNMRGTFRTLMGQHIGAIEDFARSIELDPTMTQSYIKRASITLEQDKFADAISEFAKASEQDANDPDIYYHRAQAYFINGDFTEAAKDYQKSIDLDRDFIYSHIQLGVSQYKMGSIASATATFQRCVKNFPDVADVYNYFGEILLDQRHFSEAIEKFDRAIEMEKEANPMCMNVLPMVNKALAMFQASHDAQEAEKLCKKALIIDPEFEYAAATVAQLLLQQGKVTEALGYLERVAELGRTKHDIKNAILYAEMTRARTAVQEKYPALTAKLPEGGMNLDNLPTGAWS